MYLLKHYEHTSICLETDWVRHNWHSKLNICTHIDQADTFLERSRPFNTWAYRSLQISATWVLSQSANRVTQPFTVNFSTPLSRCLTLSCFISTTVSTRFRNEIPFRCFISTHQSELCSHTSWMLCYFDILHLTIWPSDRPTASIDIF